MSAVEVDTQIPEQVTRIEPGRMQVFSLLTDDPNPIHWDRQAVQDLGLGDLLINQGGLNVGYVITAVADWAGGPERIRDVRVRFMGNVFEGEQVRAGGRVTALDDGVATVEVWLLRPDDSKAVGGTIRVAAS